MRFDDSEAAATTGCEGTTYHFCAVGCRRRFDEDPERYLENDDG